jgi:hypothetical protein
MNNCPRKVYSKVYGLQRFKTCLGDFASKSISSSLDICLKVKRIPQRVHQVHLPGPVGAERSASRNGVN